MKQKLELDDHASANIMHLPVSGKLTLKSSESPIFDCFYDYDPQTDPNRGIFKNKENGIAHPTDESFSIQGNFLRTDEEFSLLLLKAKGSSPLGKINRIHDKFVFQFGLYGAHAEWDEKVFQQASFSFDGLSDVGSFPKMSRTLFEETFEKANSYTDVIPATSQLWSIDIHDEVRISLNLSLSGKFSFHSSELLTVKSNLRFTVEALNGLLSIEDIWSKYVIPIQALLSISLGRKISPSHVNVIKYEGRVPVFCDLISTEIYSTKNDKQPTYLDLSNLTSEDYKSWLLGYNEIAFFSEILINHGFSSTQNFLIVGKLITQLEALYFRTTKSNTPAKEFGSMVSCLLSDLKKKNNVGLNGIDPVEVSTRIKDMRTLLFHETLEIITVDGQHETVALSEIVKLIYVSTLMSHLGIKWETKIADDTDFFNGTKVAVYLFQRGFRKWYRLDEIRNDAIARSSKQKPKEVQPSSLG